MTVNNKKHIIIFLLLAIVAVFFFLLDIFIGAVNIPFSEILSVLSGRTDPDEPASIIILQSRLPKAITAILVGASLPVAGLLMQTFFRNPVAGPDILGVSAGASLFVAAVMLSTGSILGISIFNTASIIISAVLGSAFILFVILSVAHKLKDTITLLIFGIMFGMAISAIVGILQYYSEKGALKLFMLWTFGSLGGVTWQQLIILIPVICMTILIIIFYSKKLNLLLLGEKYAQSLGLNITRSRYFIIFITAILTGSITAFCGPIAFIGIAVPHIARMLFKSNDHFILIPGCILTGITILLMCDIISQTPGNGGVLPLNSITACMGAPFVIYVLWKNQKMNRYF
ncbi:MAG: iron ABC transporter permease [Fimbriimonadaceae bacterium]|nr:iron ABC transporter permease [Chitinophagales bacterium]